MSVCPSEVFEYLNEVGTTSFFAYRSVRTWRRAIRNGEVGDLTVRSGQKPWSCMARVSRLVLNVHGSPPKLVYKLIRS